MLRVLVVAAVRLLFAPFTLPLRYLRRPRGAYVVLPVSGHVVDLGRPAPWYASFLPKPPPLRVESVSKLARYVAEDPARAGLVLEVESLSAGWATVDALVAALAPVRAAGKQLVVHLTRSAGPKELYLGLHASRFFVVPPAVLTTPGFGGSSLYLGPLLERAGIRIERFARREYKSAYETLERGEMSEGQRVQTEALLAGIAERMDAALALDPRRPTRAALEQAGLVTAEEALAMGLCDGVAHEDELPAALGLDPRGAPFVPAGRYFAYARYRLLPRLPHRAFIGVVPLRGVIADGSGPLGADGVVGALRALARDRRVEAIVIHVDSPGGSAFASERIHHEVTAAKKHKPVVVSFGDVAASGGYYVAAAGDAIVARPSTVTGSIGVIAARPDASALVERLGVRRETVGHAPHASLFDPTTPLGEASRAAFDRMIDASYKRFVNVVAEGRGRPYDEVEPLARGRVYLAAEAARLGLVDDLGGSDAAIARARELGRRRSGRTRGPDAAVRVVDLRRVRPGRPLAPPKEPAQGLLALVASALSGSPLWLADDALALGTQRTLLGDGTDGLSSTGGAFGMMLRKFLSISMLALLAACGGGGGEVTRLSAGPAPEGVNFHGVWFSTEYGEMHLCQSNENVVGEYTHQERHGTIRGTARGDLLEFQWHEERTFVPGRPQVTEGRGYFRLVDSAIERRRRAEEARAADPELPPVNVLPEWSLRGEWGLGENNSGGGPWTALFQPRRSPDNCYNSIRRTAPTSGGGSGEIMLPESAATTAPAP